MSTGLYIAANSSFTIEEIESKKKYWILELKKLFLNLEEKTIDTEFFEEEEWNYNYYDDSCLINITSPTPYDISIYKEVIIISTIYNYKLIYSNPSWIDDFRNDILEIFNVFGATKGIYLGDNDIDKLSSFLYKIFEHNYSFQKIWHAMRSGSTEFIKYPPKIATRDLDYRDIKEFVWDDFKPITKNKSKEKYEDPLEDIYYYLKKAKRKYTAYSLTSQVEFYLKKNIYSPEASIAAYHILACVFVWNNDYEKAKNSHHYFLSNKEWYNENKVHIEDYMNFVLAMNNRDFIKELLQDYPFLKTDYSTMYNAYLDYFIYNNTRYKDCYYPYQIKMDLTNKLYSEN